MWSGRKNWAIRWMRAGAVGIGSTTGLDVGPYSMAICNGVCPPAGVGVFTLAPQIQIESQLAPIAGHAHVQRYRPNVQTRAAGMRSILHNLSYDINISEVRGHNETLDDGRH